jgi:hypothetical protein
MGEVEALHALTQLLTNSMDDEYQICHFGPVAQSYLGVVLLS